MLKGLTACYLAEETFPAGPGQIALVHAAAGGVGSLLVPVDHGIDRFDPLTTGQGTMR